jgi:two-component system OmpR family response regulator
MSKPHVLIVDDDMNLLESIKRSLKDADFELSLAVDAYNALAMATKRQPDVLVLDINMPAGGGFSVQERLNTMDLTHIPVIYITGEQSRRVEVGTEKLNAFAVIHKPFEIEQLIATIHEALSVAST